ncbi:hypothetical protein ABIB27_003386 [Arthrobacter sp. UYEF21]
MRLPDERTDHVGADNLFPQYFPGTVQQVLALPVERYEAPDDEVHDDQE